MRVIAIDLDGTLIDKGKPIQKSIDRCNELYETTDTMVIIHTARNSSIRERTEKYLKDNGIKYHLLVMDKLRADVYVDDRSENWSADPRFSRQTIPAFNITKPNINNIGLEIRC